MRPIPLTLTAALIASAALPVFLPKPASAQVVITVGVAPPPLPLYAQPPIPGPGYLWLPGYWDYDDEFGYFWVPGTWIEPPRIGLLWTPGYWAYDEDAYAWHAGYWAERVGFYGGVDYGYGYTGTGFYGGEWRGDSYFYNRSVANIINVTTITNVYMLAVAANTTVNHVSFNGGPGGLQVRPTPQQIAFGREAHVAPTAMQQSQLQMARQNPILRETQNHGRPVVAATQQPTEFKGPGVVGARTAGSRPAGQAVPQGHNATAASGTASGKPGGAPTAAINGAPPGHQLPRPGQAGTAPVPARPGPSAPSRAADEPLALHPKDQAGAPPQHEPRPVQQAQPRAPSERPAESMQQPVEKMQRPVRQEPVRQEQRAMPQQVQARPAPQPQMPRPTPQPEKHREEPR